MGLEEDLLIEGPQLLSKKRWNHSLRTADYAVFMASHYGIGPDKVRLPALAHDLAREKSAEEILKWAILDQKILSDFHLTHPVLQHGFASAWYLRHHFGLTDPSVLNAVRYHTTGHPDLDEAGLIVFAADYMEPGRTHLTESDREAMLKLPLEELILSILESMNTYLIQRGSNQSPDSRELYQNLKKRYNKGP